MGEAMARRKATVPRDAETGSGLDLPSWSIWLRNELAERGWNNSDLSRRMGWPQDRDAPWPAAVAKWTRGMYRPRTPAAIKIARALGLPEDDVLLVFGHRSQPRHREREGDDVRRRLVALIDDIPADLLAPLVPMLEGLREQVRRQRVAAGVFPDPGDVALDPLAGEAQIPGVSPARRTTNRR